MDVNKMNDNKREKAVALRYNPETDTVPVVMAKGQGVIAQKIKELAEVHGVPIQENRELADYLMALDLYEEIPPEIYPVVAEVLAFIYRMNHKYSM